MQTNSNCSELRRYLRRRIKRVHTQYRSCRRNWNRTANAWRICSRARGHNISRVISIRAIGSREKFCGMLDKVSRMLVEIFAMVLQDSVVLSCLNRENLPIWLKTNLEVLTILINYLQVSGFVLMIFYFTSFSLIGDHWLVHAITSSFHVLVKKSHFSFFF